MTTVCLRSWFHLCSCRCWDREHGRGTDVCQGRLLNKAPRFSYVKHACLPARPPLYPPPLDRAAQHPGSEQLLHSLSQGAPVHWPSRPCTPCPPATSTATHIATLGTSTPHRACQWQTSAELSSPVTLKTMWKATMGLEPSFLCAVRGRVGVMCYCGMCCFGKYCVLGVRMH